MNNFKRFLSVFVAAMLVLSSLKSVDYIVNAAQADDNTVTYDFENGNEYLDIGIQYNKTLGNISVEDDGTGGKCLKLYNACTWEGMIVNFPYVLENNTEYAITYRLRSDEGVKVRQDGNDTANYTAGIYVGKSTGVTESGAGLSNDQAKRVGVTDYIQGRLSTLYGTGTTMYEAIPKTWTTQTKTFKTSGNAVDDNFKYLCFNFVATDKKDSNGYSSLYIDDISIEKIGSDSAEYNFESSSKSFLDFGTQWNTYNKDFNNDGVIDGAFAKVMTENEGTEQENNYLRIQNQTYKNLIVNFPYKLQNGAKYRISYKIRDDGASHLYQSDTAGSGIYLGKATGKTAVADSQQCQVSDYLGTKLHNLYGDNGNGGYTKVDKSDFTEVSYTFTVGENAVDENFCHLAINYYCKERNGSAFEYIDIDDIVIERVSTINFVPYVDDTQSTDISIAPVVGVPGNTVSLDCLKVSGYEIVGIYTDPEFTTEFEASEFTIGDTETTYYVKYKVKEIKEGVYDFEFQETSFLDFGIQYNKNSADVAVVDDAKENGNKCLKLYNAGWSGMVVNLPYELENNTSYRISYRLRSDEGVEVREDKGGANANEAAGIFVGKATGVTSTAGNKVEVKNYIKNNLAYLYDVPGKTGTMYVPVPKEWTTQEWTFTTGADTVDDTFKYLAFNFYPTGKLSNNYATLYLDDIKIEKVSSINFVAYEGDAVSSNITIPSVEGAEGTVVSFDRLKVFGYDIVGIYTDAELTNEFTGTEFTIGATPVTYYVKYVAKTYGGGDYDFETDAKGFLDFGIQLNQDSAYISVVDDEKESGNKCLKLYNSDKWNGMVVNFPYILENNTSYRISYRLRSDEGIEVREDKGGANANQAAGIFAGKATGVTSTAGNKVDVKNYIKNNLAYLYDVPGKTGTMYVPVPKEWTTQSWTFTTGDNTVDDTYKYLAFNFYPTNKFNSDKHGTLYLDDIKIEKVSSIRFFAYENGTSSSTINLPTIEDDAGVTRSLDCVNVAGYDVEGIYTDSNLTTRFTGNIFTLSEGTQTYYINYVENDKVYRFKLENSADIKKTSDAVAVTADPDGSGNNVLAFAKNWRENLVSFPYELKPNTTYALKLSYRSSSEGIVPRLYVYGVKDGSKLLENDAEYTSKRIFSIMDAVNSSSGNSLGSTVTDNFGKWITKEYVFTTGDKVDGDYKYFALGGKVQHTANANDSTECLLVDNIEIRKLDATVSFNVSYDGQKIDVPSTYPNIGDTITLPTTLTNPFELEGWYYDSACTQAVGSTLTVTDKNTVLYGKATKKNTYTINFENNTDLVDGWGNWYGIGSVVTTDPDNSENHVLKTQATAFGNYVLVRLNYQLQSNRIYEISVKYRGVDQSATVALIASKIRYPENGMGVSSGPESNRLQNSILPFVTQENVPSTWQTASLKITTDQPEITDDLKYLTVYFENRVSNTGAPNNRSLSTAYIDEITITDIGKFDPSSVVIEDAGKWTLPKEESSIWKDWASWITGEIESIFDTDNDDNQNDNNDDNNFEYNYENTGNSFEVNNEPEESTENTEEQQPTRKKKVIKKVIVTEGSNTVIIVVVVVVAVVLVGGGITAFIIIRKRKGRIS